MQGPRPSPCMFSGDFLQEGRNSVRRGGSGRATVPVGIGARSLSRYLGLKRGWLICTDVVDSNTMVSELIPSH